MSYFEITRQFTESWVTQLRSQELSGKGAVLRDRLVESVQKALTLRDQLPADDVTFHRESLRDVPKEVLEQLLNPYTPGLGNPNGLLVTSGSEPAYDFAREPDQINAALECFGLCILLLSGGTPAIAAKLSGLPVQNWERIAGHSFAEQPNAHFRRGLPDGPKRGMHAWTRQARVLNRIAGREATDHYFLDPDNADNLFRMSLQIDINAKPSRVAAKGNSAPSERQTYLEAVFPTLVKAKVFWMNVGLDDPWMGPRRTKLAKIALMLNSSETLPVDLKPQGNLLLEDRGLTTVLPVKEKIWERLDTSQPRLKKNGQPAKPRNKYIKVRWCEHNNRLVLITSGLSDSWPTEAEEFVARLIEPYLAQA